MLNTSSRLVIRLQHDDVGESGVQQTGRVQSSKPGAHNYHAVLGWVRHNTQSMALELIYQLARLSDSLAVWRSLTVKVGK